MTIRVKICGLTTRESVDVAVQSGADAIGFVFAESPRRISVTDAVAVTRNLPDTVRRVAVMHHPTQQEWDEVAAGFKPDWLQTDAEDFDDLCIDTAVKKVRVFRDSPNVDLGAVEKSRMVIFEAPVSGAGQQADWVRARALARLTDLMLAGGLTPDNVRAAISQVHPWGVDVSSGVERTRGVKDPGKISAFIDAVREMESINAG